MAEIAAEAGVAVQTVYKVMGSKAAIMGSLIEVINETADVAVRQRELAAAETAPAILAAGIALMSQIQERCGDIIVAIHSAAATAPEAADALADGERFHRIGTADMVKRIAALGRVPRRPGDWRRGSDPQHHDEPSRLRELVGAHALTYEQAASWLEGSSPRSSSPDPPLTARGRRRGATQRSGHRPRTHWLFRTKRKWHDSPSTAPRLLIDIPRSASRTGLRTHSHTLNSLEYGHVHGAGRACAAAAA